MKQNVILLLIVIAIILLAAIFSLGNFYPGQQQTTTTVSTSASTTTAQVTTTVPTQTTTVQPQTYNVGIVNYAFSPSTLNIKVGDTVVWTNNATTSHTVVSDSGTELNSGPLITGRTYSHKFNQAGTFAYHCSIHPSMTATVIVGA
jgi:plastocyanin